MSTLVLGAAPRPGAEAFYAGLLAAAERVVAADGAGEWAMELGRAPDLVVGDFDSAAAGAEERLAAAGVPVRRVSPDKDVSDLGIALREALLDAPSTITVSCASTGRLDHTLAALGEMARACAEGTGTVIEMREPGLTVWVAHAVNRPEVKFEAPVGSTVSVLALGPAQGVEAHGVRWPLFGTDMGALDSLGLSNASTETAVTVRIRTGMALVIVLDDQAKLLPSG
jgi:thiamine pyrophosphokinase